MFRRRPSAPRPLARPVRRLLRPLAPPPPPVPPASLEVLRRANHLMDKGQYPQAAEIFERLASVAARMTRPRQAANLFLQAGHALVLAGQVAAGIKLAQQGLTILADVEAWELFDQFGARAVGELEQQGQRDAARQLSEWIKTRRSGQPAPTPDSQPSPQPARLPGKCPSCGASVRPDEVEWFDEATAECAYCGSVLQTQD